MSIIRFKESHRVLSSKYIGNWARPRRPAILYVSIPWRDALGITTKSVVIYPPSRPISTSPIISTIPHIPFIPVTYKNQTFPGHPQSPMFSSLNCFVHLLIRLQISSLSLILSLWLLECSVQLYSPVSPTFLRTFLAFREQGSPFRH